MAETLLALSDLRAGYGESVVLDGISLQLAEGGSLAVLGRNGVGKTTLLLTIMGFTRVVSGGMSWRGRYITPLAPHRRARLGIGWVAQEREIFPSARFTASRSRFRASSHRIGVGSWPSASF